VSVKHVVVLAFLALAFAGALGASPAASAPAQLSSSTHAATRSVTINVRLIQEVTYHLPGGWLSTTLHLFAIGEQIGFPPNTFLGSMSFTYLLHGHCGASVAGCSGTTDLKTVTTFPGGTISASGLSISLTSSLVVPITSGTGAFKGVTGSIVIAPDDAAMSIYRLTLPA
jgi:hypothetical protein